MDSFEKKLARRMREAETVLMTSEFHYTPCPESWGVAAAASDPSGTLDASFYFSWFHTRAELFDFMGRLLVFSNYHVLSPDPFCMAKKTKELVDQVESGGLNRLAAVPQFNDICRFNSEVLWWGPLSELVGGSGDFERGLRHKWRRIYYKTLDESPIADEDGGKFISLLNNMMDMEN
jgi:hypothetical protein